MDRNGFAVTLVPPAPATDITSSSVVQSDFTLNFTYRATKSTVTAYPVRHFIVFASSD